jgi:hypothetical protein
VATDHNRVSDYGPAVKAVGASRFITTVVGDEVTTRGFKFGHFNVFPLRYRPDQPDNGALAYADTTPRELFRRARREPGRPVLQVNHPRMPPDIGYFDLVGFDARTGRAADDRYGDDYDAIEVFNGTDLPLLRKVNENLRDWMALLNLGRRYTATGNSDSHRVRFESAGYPRTYVRVPAPRDGEAASATSPRSDAPGRIDVGAAMAAIRRGQATVTSGPFVEVSALGKGPGEQVSLPASRRLPVRVRVQAPPWQDVSTVELWSNGERVASVPVAARAGDVVRFDGQLDVPVTRDGWVLAVVRGKRAYPDRLLPFTNVVPLAFTNPIWIDADGDGKVRTVGPRDIPIAEERR